MWPRAAEADNSRDVPERQDEDLLPHTFGLQLDDSPPAATEPASGGGKGAAAAPKGAAGGALAALSLAEDRLTAGGGDRRGLGFGAAAAGPMPGTPSSPTGDATAVEQLSVEEPLYASAKDPANCAPQCDRLQPSVNGTAAADRGQGESRHAQQVAASPDAPSAARPEPAVQIREVAAALLARLRFRRQLHQVKPYLRQHRPCRHFRIRRTP